MLYMIIEHYKGSRPDLIYSRLRKEGRLLPEGLAYVSSWVGKDLDRCFQLMETDDPGLIEEWTSKWADLVDFEVYPVISSREATASTADP